jgi:hypothetical protein
LICVYHSSFVSNVAEACHFYTLPVPTSYFPSYGSGSGSDSDSLQNLKKNFKGSFCNHIFIETGWKQVDFHLECSPTLIPFNNNISSMVPVPTSYFPSYGSGSGSDSLQNFKKNFKESFCNHIFIETGWKQVDFNLECSTTDSF